MANKPVKDSKKDDPESVGKISGHSKFGNNKSIFSGNKNFQQKGFSRSKVSLPQIRITQNKGGGGK